VVKIIRLSPAVMPVLCGVLCRYEGTKRLIHSTRGGEITSKVDATRHIN
jgi:hypothetical protein